MTRAFRNKRVLLGVTGSIAAYKAVDLASKLTQAEAAVDVLLTPAATQFVTPLTFRSVTHRPVVSNVFDPASPEAVEHVSLALAADVLVVAPATADIIAKLAHGFADDPVSLVALATAAPLVVAAAMDAHMWGHPAVQANVATVRERGATFVGPAAGHLASGLEGMGRFVETPELLGRIAQVLGRDGDLAGRTVVVTAGGTQEPIDPVRVVTNRSSGKMGYAVAEAARDRGARVRLVAATTSLPDPPGVEVTRAATAAEMLGAVRAACEGADALIMAAAVADYRPARSAADKIKKEGAGTLTVEMERTDDILLAVKGKLVRVGFAAESRDLLKNAEAKLRSKRLDLIVANDITAEGAGFGADTNKVTLVANTTTTDLPLLPKYDVAWEILDRVAGLLDRTGRPR